MDLIVIPFHDCKKWIKEGYRTRDAHLIQHFSNNKEIRRILVINRPVSLAEFLYRGQSWRTSDLLLNKDIVEQGRNYEIGNLVKEVYYLDVFLYDFINVILKRKAWWDSAYSNKYTIEKIEYAIRKLKIKDYIFLVQNPMGAALIDRFNYKKFVFDAIDNWNVHPQMKTNYKLIKSNYDKIDKKSNIIFTVSKNLMNIFKNKNVYYQPNAVDIDYFKPARMIYKKNEQVTVGYVGKIQERVDFLLVEKCLDYFKDINFVFIGPILAQLSVVERLKTKYKNIKFIGDVHYEKLPYEMKLINIAIIPHVVDDFTSSMNPLKTYEYLAAAKPVVTTPVEGIMNISKYVYVSEQENFIYTLEKVVNLLKNNSININDIPNSIDEKYTWEYRANNILKIMKNEG